VNGERQKFTKSELSQLFQSRVIRNPEDDKVEPLNEQFAANWGVEDLNLVAFYEMLDGVVKELGKMQVRTYLDEEGGVVSLSPEPDLSMLLNEEDLDDGEEKTPVESEPRFSHYNEPLDPYKHMSRRKREEDGPGPDDLEGDLPFATPNANLPDSFGSTPGFAMGDDGSDVFSQFTQQFTVPVQNGFSASGEWQGTYNPLDTMKTTEEISPQEFNRRVRGGKINSMSRDGWITELDNVRFPLAPLNQLPPGAKELTWDFMKFREQLKADVNTVVDERYVPAGMTPAMAQKVKEHLYEVIDFKFAKAKADGMEEALDGESDIVDIEEFERELQESPDYEPLRNPGPLSHMFAPGFNLDVYHRERCRRREPKMNREPYPGSLVREYKLGPEETKALAKDREEGIKYGPKAKLDYLAADLYNKNRLKAKGLNNTVASASRTIRRPKK